MSIVADSFSAPTPVSRESLVSQVTRLYGLEDDDELRAKALDMLDNTVIEMNTRLWRFMRTSQLDITVTADDETVTLTSAFHREDNAWWSHKTDGSKSKPLTYLPHAHYVWMTRESTDSGRATLYTARNTHEDGKVCIWPKVDSDTADNLNFNIEYFQRIPLVSGGIQIDVPQEVQSALIAGGHEKLAAHLLGPSHGDALAQKQDYTNKVEALKRIDTTNPDEQMRFRLVDNVRRSTTVPDRLTIRVGS